MNLNLEKITRDLERCIISSQKYPFGINCEKIVKEWYHAKKSFIDKFNGQTYIVSEHITLSLTPEIKNNYFKKFTDYSFNISSHSFQGVEFYDFLNANKEGFFENKVVNTCGIERIKLGSKLLKAFKFFIYDTTELRAAQDKASMSIQQNSVQGKLFLSVDPLDFLTLSENNCGWHSCHSLDGEYRAGNLSYMLDNTTVIAYFATDKKEKLLIFPEDIPWYSKKWRMLMHIQPSNNIIYFSKQYPYENYQLEDTARTQWNKISNSDYLSIARDGFNIIVTPNGERNVANHLYFYGHLVDLSEVVKLPSEDLMYNDIVSSCTFAPHVSYHYNFLYKNFERTQQKIKKLNINIGESVLCCCCNKNYLTSGESFLCDSCREMNDAWGEFFTYCECCGCRIDDGKRIFNNMIYCKKCYNIEQGDC